MIKKKVHLLGINDSDFNVTVCNQFFKHKFYFTLSSRDLTCEKCKDIMKKRKASRLKK